MSANCQRNRKPNRNWSSRRYVNENARGPGNARLLEFRKAGEGTRREVESRG